MPPFFSLLLPFLTASLTASPSLALAAPHPSTHLNALFDAIYVIGLPHCTRRWNLTLNWSRALRLSITRVPATPYHSIDLDQPPIPVLRMPPDASVTSGQVACTHSHVRVWRDAFRRNFSRILVLEDDVRLRKRVVRELPGVVGGAEGGARVRGEPWHLIYLRFYPTVLHGERDDGAVWYGGVPVARPGWGTAAYVASYHGIRFLLTRVTAYSYPLDIQIERFQKGLDTQGARFVALHACGMNHKGNPIPNCPENIHELTLAERGNCQFSATQSGDRRMGSQMPSPLVA